MFCLKCKKTTKDIKEGKKRTANGRLMKVSTCAICNGIKHQFIKEQDGEGLTEIYEGTKKLITEGVAKVLGSRPPALKKALNDYGDYKIIGVRVCRHPIRSFITKALNFLIGGELEERLAKLNYDKLFHLFMNLTMEKDGDVIYLRTERNQRVTAIPTKEPYKETPEDECKDATSFPKGMKYSEFMERSEKLGGSNFYRYDAVNNNCQDYCLTLTKANKIKGLDEFIKQELNGLLSPALEKLAKGITDVGAVVDAVLSGGGDKYCGAKTKIPKGKTRGTAKECVDASQIRYYGIEQLDEETKKRAQNKGKRNLTRSNQLKKVARLRGKLSKIIREIKHKKRMEQDDEELQNLKDAGKVLIEQIKNEEQILEDLPRD